MLADMHNFSASQPDLNWDNPEVRDAVFDVIDFWGKKGTDGFRVSLNTGSKCREKRNQF